MMNSRIIDSLLVHAQRRPDAIAISEVDGVGTGRSITWSQLARAAGGLAQHVRGGVKPDGVVLVSSHNQIELAIAVLGGLWGDARVFAVQPDLTQTELRAAARESAAAMIISTTAAREMLGDDSVAWLPLGDLSRLDAAPTHPHHGRGALLLQSSGTVGPSKIVRRDTPALDAVAANCAAALSLDASSRMLIALPLCHSFGLEHGILSCTLAGSTLELHRRFEPEWVAAALASGRVTHMPGVPFMFDIMAQRGLPRCGPNIRHIYSAGSPLPAAVADAFHSATGVPLSQLYGATEFGSITFNDPHRLGFDPLSVGVAMDGVRLRIIDRDNPDINAPLPAGTEGQLAVAAPSMFSGYLGHAPPATCDGWFLTGDLGRLDAAGRLTITGRLKLMIDTGGMKVNPFEVESVLTLHPSVREAVVVPIPMTPTLNRLKAVIQLQPGSTVSADDLRRFAQQHLSTHKVPRVFDIRPSLPRTPTGKVLREALQWS